MKFKISILKKLGELKRTIYNKISKAIHEQNEEVNKEIEIIKKKNQTKILEQKIAMN